MRKYLFFLLVIGIYGCSGGSTLNLKSHHFDNIPRQIIWIQVPGLSEEHLATLKFVMSHTGEKTAFEEMPCIGKMWHYNLFELGEWLDYILEKHDHLFLLLLLLLLFF